MQYLIMLLAGVFGFGLVAQAKDDDLGNVNSVLDRLERRIMDQEADGLTFEDKTRPPATLEPTDPAARYKFENKGTINATTSEREQMASLASAITELETQVDQLASNVQKTKQSILDESKVNNFIGIEAQLSETDAAAIKTLNIKLDGYPVYELQEASGLWLPSKAVPLYAGPLQPGKHRLDLEARIVMRHQSGMPMNGDVYRFINKSFEMTVSGGTTKSRYVITITPPGKIEEQADAVLKEVI